MCYNTQITPNFRKPYSYYENNILEVNTYLRYTVSLANGFDVSARLVITLFVNQNVLPQRLPRNKLMVVSSSSFRITARIG